MPCPDVTPTDCALAATLTLLARFCVAALTRPPATRTPPAAASSGATTAEHDVSDERIVVLRFGPACRFACRPLTAGAGGADAPVPPPAGSHVRAALRAAVRAAVRAALPTGREALVALTTAVAVPLLA